MHPQIPLPIASVVQPTMGNFARGENGLIVDIVEGLAGNNTHGDDGSVRQVYLWGTAHCGKTHLLLAAHRQWLAMQRRSFYVSLKDAALSPLLLESLDGYDLIALDDIHMIAKNPAWEQALFNLINFTREGQGKILFSATIAPSADTWALADLVSRLAWGPVLKLQALNEAQIHSAMMAAANDRGMKLDSEAADFLLKRYSRDVNSLLKAVETLDRESLAAGRERITIPFLKRCFVFG